MKTKLFLSLAAVALATVSCTNDEVIESAVTKADNAISFSTYAQGTRASNEINNAQLNANGSAFGVCAYSAAVDAQSNPAGTKCMDKNVKIVSNGTSWGYASSDNVAFWPKVETAFYAYYPYAESGVDYPDDIKSLENTGTVISVPVDGTKDVLVASNSLTKPDNGIVPLTFAHVLAKIKEVNVTVSAERLSLEITGVELLNSKTTGNVLLRKNGTTDMVSATPSVARTIDLSGNNKKTANKTAGKVTLFDTDKDAYIFPTSAADLWDGSTGTNVVSGKVCLKLTATAKLAEIQVYSGVIYIPLCGSNATHGENVTTGFDMVAGKRYIFNVTMSNNIGFDANGAKLLELNQINFSASTSDWADDVTVNITI